MVTKPKKASDGEQTFLGNWSDVLNAMSAANARTEAERLANARASADMTIATAANLDDAELVARLVHVSGMGDHNARILTITHEVRDALQAEVLRRLSQKG